MISLLSIKNDPLIKNFCMDTTIAAGNKYFWRFDFVPTKFGLASLFIQKNANDLAKFIHLYNSSKYTRNEVKRYGKLNLKNIFYHLVPCQFNKDGEIVAQE